MTAEQHRSQGVADPEAPEEQLGRVARVGPRMMSEIEKMKSQGWRRMEGSREPKKRVCKPGLLQDPSVLPSFQGQASQTSRVWELSQQFAVMCCGILMHGLAWKM